MRQPDTTFRALTGLKVLLQSRNAVLSSHVLPSTMHLVPSLTSTPMLTMLRFLSLPLLLLAPVLATPADPAKPTSGDVVVSEKALAIHREARLIDGHNDLPWE